LAVELQVEKELKISGKPDIEKYGVEKFNQKCKESVWLYKGEWEKITRRIAFWLDMEHPYVTYSNDYIESLWWILKQVNEKGLLYKGYKVVPQCPRCGTALSSHEVAQGYQSVKESSVYIKFKVVGQDNTYILSWTTTPWTLPGNVALAIGEKVDYVKVKFENEFLILGKPLLNKVFGNEVEVVEEIKLKDLLKMEYEPLFPGAIPSDVTNYQKAFKVYPADFVTTEDGTGVVHTAVMYGVDDFELGLKVCLPQVHTVNENGEFLPTVEKWAGRFVKDKALEKEIVADLQSRGLLFKEMLYEHDYPFCWRCETPLLYYAKDSWFIKMSSLRKELVKNGETINWVPENIKEGRFGEWIKNVNDWAISRERYWGTPLPIWICGKCGKQEVVGSFAELEKLAGALPKDRDGKLDPHKPFVDELTVNCPCGGKMKRTPEVCDCWFDSGSMPFAQYHYPFENKELIDKKIQFPAEYISEAIDQTRGWFYTLLAVSTLLGKSAPYKNVICYAHIRDKFGKKMSKSRNNIVDPWEMMDKYGVDSLRMLFYSMNQPGEYKNFDEKLLREMLNKCVMLLNNIVSFYKMYATDATTTKTRSKNLLDKWIISKLNSLINEVTEDLNNYHIFESSRRLIVFVDELSTWYVRRSRDRFKDEAQRGEALATLKEVLGKLSLLMAPFAPFIAEQVWQDLGNKESVHLQDWPEFEKKLVDAKLLENMQSARKIVELGLAKRDEAKIKVRQPLASLKYGGKSLDAELESIVAEELNVKAVTFDKNVVDAVELDLVLTDELEQEGLLRELVRTINGLRRENGFTIADRVKLIYETNGEALKKLFANGEMVEQLKKSTLLSSLELGSAEKATDVNGESIKIRLE
ncbi:MAG: isoleucine--tRNA ligase, partial [Parcubacteria group bacterium]